MLQSSSIFILPLGRDFKPWPCLLRCFKAEPLLVEPSGPLIHKITKNHKPTRLSTGSYSKDSHKKLICSIPVISLYFRAEWKTVWILIRWLHQRPADLDLHCFLKFISMFSRTIELRIILFLHLICRLFLVSPMGFHEEMKKVNKQCLLDTPRTVRVSEKTWQMIVQTRRP